MLSFSPQSLQRLNQCHPNLQRVFNEVVKTFDCTVFTGQHSQEGQDELFRQGKSKVS